MELSNRTLSEIEHIFYLNRALFEPSLWPLYKSDIEKSLEYFHHFSEVLPPRNKEIILVAVLYLIFKLYLAEKILSQILCRWCFEIK